MKRFSWSMALIGLILVQAGNNPFGTVAIGQGASQGAGQSASLTRDEVYFSLARRINSQSTSPVSAIVNALGEVIEVGQITVGADGKATVMTKELEPSNARATNKSIRLVFIPASEPGKWTWESFEDNRRLYPVERLFPYSKERLDRARQATVETWNKYLESMTLEGEAANRVLETTKVLIKADPPPLNPVTAARKALEEAKKGTEVEPILNAFRDLETAIEPVVALGDTYPDLKANDAYLRLQEDLKRVRDLHAAAKKAYTDSVFAYNDEICRLPFSLVAYGLEHTKIEAKIQPE